MVVDAEDGTVSGDIPDTQGVHGIAVVEELGKEAFIRRPKT
jgi:hypothetical protein